MPPRKRARTTTKATTGGKSSATTNEKKNNHSIEDNHHDTTLKTEGAHAQEQTTRHTPSLSSSPTPPPHSPPLSASPSIDPALLDEEEAPSSQETQEPPDGKKPSLPRHFGGGGGGYNALKSHHGQLYTGMSIGASHTWNYDQGVWKETKKEPDLWDIDFRTTKRRARNAPKGSGAPVGTEYHWLIVGHQHVKKIDANTYETHLTGSKYKLAHKTVSSSSSTSSAAGQKGVWSIPTVKAQRDREVELLEDAKRRVLNLPPVLASEKVKVELGGEKGQQKLDALFAKAKNGGGGGGGGKRKREGDVGIVGERT